MLSRKHIVSLHLTLAAFFAPLIILTAITGGLYLLGERGSVQYTPIHTINNQILTSDKQQLNALLTQAGVNTYHVNRIKSTDNTIITYPSSRNFYRFTQKGSNIEISLAKPSLLASIIALHKGYGPDLYLYLQKALALALLFIMLSGLTLGLQSPMLRKRTMIIFLTGFISTALLAHIL